MKKTFFTIALLVAVWAVPAIEVDIFKSAGDPRIVDFTIPAGEKDPLHKSFIIEGGGKKYYPQTLMISRYPNGAARWYRLSADLPAGRYTVTPGKLPPKAVKNAVKAVKKLECYSNKLYKLSFEKKPFVIKVTSGKEEFAIHAPRITLPDGSQPEAVFEKVQLFDSGNTVTGLEFRGKYDHKSDKDTRYWRLRITMWANKPFIGVEPLLGAALKKPRTPGKVAEREWKYGVTAYEEMLEWKSATMQIEAVKAPALGKICHLTQWEDHSYEKLLNGKSETVKGALGLFDLAGRGSLAIPEMAERFPIGVTQSGNKLNVNLFPEIQPVNRYAKRDKEYVHYFALRTGNYVIRAGVEVSFPMYLVLNKKVDAAKLLSPVPVGLVDVEDLQKSGAWLNYIGKPDKYSKYFDKEILIGLDSYLNYSKKERWYGFLNYGDSHGERTWNWFNNEYDAAAIFFEQALRFRKPEYFREAVRSIRHQMEVDTVKSHPGGMNGAIYTHSMGHTGGYYKDGEFKFSNYGGGGKLFVTSKVSNGHMRIRGMCMGYVLTGDRRFRDTANMTGDYIRSTQLFVNRTWSATHREPGWALVNLTSIYWMNATPRFLRACEDLAWTVMAQARGRGVRHDRLERHNAPKPPEGWNEKNSIYRTGALSFPTGYQATGMYLVYKITRDEYLQKALRDNLKATANYVKTRLYYPDRKGFVHSPVPWRRQSTRNGSGAGNAMRNVLLIDTLLTGDKESRAISCDTMQQMLTRREVFASPLKNTDPDNPDPKGVTSGLYFVPLTLELMRQLDIVMPEIKYDLSQRYSWNGTVDGMSGIKDKGTGRTPGK